MLKIFGLIVLIIILLGIVGICEMIVAYIITWALNSFTQLHPTFWTVFVALIIFSALTGGGEAVSRK